MNEAEERRLATAAWKAKSLRACIDGANAILDSWKRRKDDAGDVHIYMCDGRATAWYVGVDLPAEFVQVDFVPILERMRNQAVSDLRSLALPESDPL